jgi:tRNA-dihydrouridine synthase A
VINGGLRTDAEIAAQLAAPADGAPALDGAMIGRQAYHEPWQMAGWDEAYFGQPGPAHSREQVEDAWVDYLQGLHERGQPWMLAMRHALGLYNGQPGARTWRQFWSDHRIKTQAPRALLAQFRSRRPVQAMAAPQAEVALISPA